MADISLEEAKARYDAAWAEAQLWFPLLENAYQYAMPNKEEFYDPFNRERGESKVKDLYDATAMNSLQQFAADTLALLMPAFQEWFSFVPGWQVQDKDKDDAIKFTQQLTEIFFRYVDLSNLYLHLFTVFKEMGISTGVLLVHEGETDDEPIFFESVPIYNIAMEAGPHGNIENMWRQVVKPARLIERIWPGSKLPPGMEHLAETSEEIRLIEGNIFDPSEPKGAQWFYYVATEGHGHYIFRQKRSYKPYIVMRTDVNPPDLYGYGPVLLALPFIRLAQAISKFEIKAARFRAFPVYLMPTTGLINPATVRIEPGAIIPIEPSAAGSPITALPNSGDVQFVQLSLANMQQKIQDIMNVNALGPITAPTKSATEVNVRNQETVKLSQALNARTLSEALKLIKIIATILIKKGLLPGFNVDHKLIDIQYNSPIANIQNQQEVQRTLDWVQQVQSTLGPQGLVFNVNTQTLGGWLAEKQNIPNAVVNTALQKQKITSQFQKQEAQQQQAQAQQGQAQQPSPPPANDPDTVPTQLIQGNQQ